EGLYNRYLTNVFQKLGPEAGIEQVAGCMLCTANVQVYGLPVLLRFFANQVLLVAWIHVAEKVPAGAGPARHGTGLERMASAGFPVAGAGQRRLACFGRQVGIYFR